MGLLKQYRAKATTFRDGKKAADFESKEQNYTSIITTTTKKQQRGVNEGKNGFTSSPNNKNNNGFDKGGDANTNKKWKSKRAGAKERRIRILRSLPLSRALTEQELAMWSNANLVELWGYRSDMHDVLSAASVVVLPSYREGLPKVLIEAAACGRVVVTTDVPGCRDSIEAGVTGLLVPVRDAKALAKAIQELVRDPARCSQMGKAARELAEREFDVRKVVAAHMRIYDDLMEHAR